MAKRPPTMKEIRKVHERTIRQTITIVNCSKQVVSIQCKAPLGVDFFIGETAVRICPNKRAELDKSRVRMDQIKNLQQQGFIRVVSIK